MSIDLTYETVPAEDEARVQECHALLAGTMGAGNVEDVNSFAHSLSHTTRTGVFPEMIAASHNGRIEGAVVGAYIRELKAGMVMYAGVRSELRGRGIYTTLRSRLVDTLADAARESGAEGLRYIVSEVEEGTLVHRKYVEDLGAYVAPFRYEQPETQGLQTRSLKLVVLPVVDTRHPTVAEALDIVGVLYENIYRLDEPRDNVYFRRVVESSHDSSARDQSEGRSW